MKILLLSLFVATAFAAPAPLDEETGEPVELIVNGIAEGEPLELDDVLGIKVKEHVDGEFVSSTNVLYPLSAAGLEAAAASENPEPVDVVEQPDNIDIGPELVQLPDSVAPEVVPLPPLEESESIPESIDMPTPALPEVVPLPPIHIPGIVPDFIEEQIPIDIVPELVPEIPTGEIFNDGVVQVTLNAPEHGVLTTVQSWFNMVLNYFNGEVHTTHQIV